MATTRLPVLVSQRDTPQGPMETVSPDGDTRFGGLRSLFGGAKTGASGDAPPTAGGLAQYDASQTGYNAAPRVDYGRDRQPATAPTLNSLPVQGSATTSTKSVPTISMPAKTWTTGMPGDYPQEMVECGCCFDNVAMNRTATCSARDPHHFCFTCAKKMADEAIIKANYELVCMDVSGCSASFSESQLQLFLDRKTYQRFDRLRTDNEIRKAGIEGLVYCPFCPYAAILDNPNDTEFECHSCRIKSCRTCRIKSHRGRTCQEIQAEKARNPRQIVEEAMSEAMVRKCNQCGLRFTKLEGCNQMTCRCGNRQCFVCSRNVSYEHFTDTPGGCPMYCDVEQLFDREVTQAKTETVQKLKKNKPDLKEEEIVPKVPDVPRKQPQQPQQFQPHMMPGMGGYNGGPPGMMPIGIPRFNIAPPTIVIPPPPPPFMVPAGVNSPFGQAPPMPQMYTPPAYIDQQHWPPLYQYPGPAQYYPPAPFPAQQMWNPYPTPPPTNIIPPPFPNMPPQAPAQAPRPRPVNHPNSPVGQYNQPKVQTQRAMPMQNRNHAGQPNFLGGYPPPPWPGQNQGRKR